VERLRADQQVLQQSEAARAEQRQQQQEHKLRAEAARLAARVQQLEAAATAAAAAGADAKLLAALEEGRELRRAGERSRWAAASARPCSAAPAARRGLAASPRASTLPPAPSAHTVPPPRREEGSRLASEAGRLRANAKELEGLLAAARAAAKADRDAAGVLEKQLLRAREEHDVEVRHLASELAKVRQQVRLGSARMGWRGTGGWRGWGDGRAGLAWLGGGDWAAVQWLLPGPGLLQGLPGALLNQGLAPPRAQVRELEREVSDLQAAPPLVDPSAARELDASREQHAQQVGLVAARSGHGALRLRCTGQPGCACSCLLRRKPPARRALTPPPSSAPPRSCSACPRTTSACVRR
jgi:hypothetical protein